MPRDLDQLLPPGGALTGRLFSRLIGSSSDDPPLPPGTLVGYWRVGELLGRGGSSIVYLADRADGQFEQKAALKIVNTSHGLMEHFRRERQILAELHHPAIAQLIDGGQLPGGRLWFAMEPVIGQRIDRYVRDRRLPLKDRLALFDAACEAVAYAHSRLLIHRDIKPGNLLVDELGRPRLLDFGIATSSEGGEGASAMTPTYASPEQRSGGAITTASDIYQLGLLLGALALPHGEPCATLPRAMRPVVRKELAAIVAHATELEPSHRYPTVAALRADIAAVQRRQAVSVLDGVRYPAARFLERNAMSSAIAITAAVVLLSTGWVFAHRVRMERDQARAAAVRSKATSDFLVSLFSVSDPNENRGERLTASQILARGAAQLGNNSTKDPAQMAAVALEIGRVYTELGEYRHAMDVLAAATKIAESRLPPGAQERIALRTQHGRAAYFVGEYETASDDLALARGQLDLVTDRMQRDAFEGAIETEEAQLLRRLGRTEEALKTQIDGLQHLGRVGNADVWQVGAGWNNLGIIQRERHDYQAAIAAYEQAIAILREHYGVDDVRMLAPRNNLGEVLMLNGDLVRAERLLTENIERLKTLQEGPSTKLAMATEALAQIRIDQHRYAEAKVLAQEADDEYAQLLGREHNYRGYTLVHVGHAKLGLGDGPGALEAFQESLRLRRLAFGDEHPDVANSWDNLGQAYAKLGDLNSAESAYREALRIRERVLPTGHIVLPRTRMKLAAVLVALHMLQEARTEIARAADELDAAEDDTLDDRNELAGLDELLARAEIHPTGV